MVSARSLPPLPLEVGDIIFIRMGTPLFGQVAKDTGSWTNHVGIIADISGKEPIVAESKFPFSTLTPLSRFIARSVGGKVEIKRMHEPLTKEEKEKLATAIHKRLGIFYDPGFNLHSHRQFCSRFVYEVVREATGCEIGTVETLATLFDNNPQAWLGFWHFWYLGRIPWQRETVTPASLLHNHASYTVLSGDEAGYIVTPLHEASVKVTHNKLKG